MTGMEVDDRKGDSDDLHPPTDEEDGRPQKKVR